MEYFLSKLLKDFDQRGATVVISVLFTNMFEAHVEHDSLISK